jgi:MFS family permease
LSEGGPNSTKNPDGLAITEKAASVVEVKSTVVPSNRSLVLASVVSSRTVYSLNWYNFAPALPLIGTELGIDTFGLAVITSSFLLGAGLFQVPAGFIAAHWGNKNTSQLGMLILSISAIAEGLSPSFPYLFLSRLMLGVGASLFFSPAIGVLTPLFREREEGLVIGLYNGAFSVGGGIGLWVWALIMNAPGFGWRFGLVLGGFLGLSFFLIGQVVVPKDKGSRPAYSSIRPVLRSRNIWIIALGVLGLWGGTFTAAQFLPKFLHDVRGVPLDTAGLLSSLLLFASMIGGPLGGFLSDRLRRRKEFILVPGVIASVLLGFIGVAPIDGLWFLIPAIGFLYAMVFSTMYASASQYPEVGHRYAPLGISLMNSVHILGAVAIPIGYALAVKYSGANLAGWIFISSLALVLMTIITKLQEPFDAKESNR